MDKTYYLPFGEYRRGDSSILTESGFTGHLHNDTLGLIYMNARFYSPSSGRFISADTIVPNPNNPQSFNRYSYTYNNPVNGIDPSGHCVEAFSGASREENLASDDSACWDTYYNWLDQGYSGLDPAWNYVRDDIWLIEELHLQYGIMFSSLWDHNWSVDSITNNSKYGQQCYGENCFMSYQRLLLEVGGGNYLTMFMDGLAAWVFQIDHFVINPLGYSTQTTAAIGIGTDQDKESIQDAMLWYQRYYDDSITAIGSKHLATASLIASVGSAPWTGGFGMGGLGLSIVGYRLSQIQLDQAYSNMATQWGNTYNLITALQVRVYDNN